MQDKFLAQYESIRGTIKANVATIRELIRQAESLKSIVATIKNPTAQASITAQIEDIEVLIGNLVDQTDKLFNQYQSFVKDVFAKGQ